MVANSILEHMVSRHKKIKEMTAQEFRDYKREKRQGERQEITEKNLKRIEMVSTGVLGCGCTSKAKWSIKIGWHCPKCGRKI